MAAVTVCFLALVLIYRPVGAETRPNVRYTRINQPRKLFA